MRLTFPLKTDTISLRERSQFLVRLAALMKEGYLLPTALTLLLPMHTKEPDAALEGVTTILKGGGNAAEILKFLGFKDRVLFPVEIAEYHGRLADSLDGIAKSHQRTDAVQKKLKGILVYPVSLLIFTALLFLFFRTSYVPNLTDLMSSLQNGEEGGGVPVYLLNLPDYFIALFGSCTILIFVYVWLLKKQKIKKQIRWLLAVPILRGVMRLYWAHLMSRELGTLLHSGISLQEALQLLQQQEYHKTIQYMSKVSHEEVIMGQPLSAAISRFDFFADDMSSFIAHGEIAGYLGKELILYSEVMMERIERMAQAWLRIIQPAFFVIIAVCIVGAYLAILLPMYNLVHTI